MWNIFFSKKWECVLFYKLTENASISKLSNGKSKFSEYSFTETFYCKTSDLEHAPFWALLSYPLLSPSFLCHIIQMIYNSVHKLHGINWSNFASLLKACSVGGCSILKYKELNWHHQQILVLREFLTRENGNKYSWLQ